MRRASIPIRRHCTEARFGRGSRRETGRGQCPDSDRGRRQSGHRTIPLDRSAHHRRLRTPMVAVSALPESMRATYEPRPRFRFPE